MKKVEKKSIPVIRIDMRLKPHTLTPTGKKIVTDKDGRVVGEVLEFSAGRFTLGDVVSIQSNSVEIAPNKA